MSYLEKLREIATAEVLKLVIPLLLLPLLTALAGLIPQIRHTLLSLSPSWLLGLLAISLLTHSGTLAYIVILKRQGRTDTTKLKTRLDEMQRKNERLTEEQQPVEEPPLLDIELQILALIAHHSDCTTDKLAAHLGVSEEKVLYHKDELVEHHYIDYGLDWMDREYYSLLPQGQKVLNDRGLL